MKILAVAFGVAVAISHPGSGQGASDGLAAGYGYLTMGWFPEAARQFREVADRHPDDLESPTMAGLIYSVLGEHRQALATLSRGAALEGAAPELWVLVGEIHRALGDLQGAQTAYERALAQRDDLALAYRGMALAAEGRGETQAAREFYERSLAVSPAQPWVRIQLARNLMAESLWEAALEHLLEAKRMRPRDPEPQWLLGQVYYALGDEERAVHALNRTLQLDPHHREAARLLRELSGS